MTTPNRVFAQKAILPEGIEELAKEAREADTRAAEERGIFWAAVRKGDAAAAEAAEIRVENAEAAASRAWRKARRADLESGQKRRQAE